MAEIILPGTYITVRDEALISAGRVVTGNIGIVGTASKGPMDEVQILGNFTEAKEIFGESDLWDENENELTLIRALEQVYNNGGRTVYAVRTASANASKATYQTKDDSDANLTNLEARTPGTWGNEIKIKISGAGDNAFISEQFPWDPGNPKLGRSHIVAESGLNSIMVKKQNTGRTLHYEIVYDDTAVNNDLLQVNINTSSGALTFTTSEDVAPVGGDMVTARYEVPAANSKKVELSYGVVKETYTIADADHLAEQVNKVSALVSASEPDETIQYSLPQNTDGDKLFGSGLNGHTAGSNGEDASPEDYKNSLAKLENEIINIVLLAGQDVSNSEMVTTLLGHINTTAEIKRERIGIIGSNSSDDVSAIAGHNLNSERLVFAAPGIKVTEKEVLPGAYMAAAVAGLISSLPVQTSPTNKVLNIPMLSTEFTSSQLEKLVLNRVLAVEKRQGFRVVKGITTATNTAWHQITTRRIVDYAIYGVRSACNPYIGKLNNERVRGAMKATLDAFLTRMVENEALISYELEVTATRAQQIAGEAIVTMTIRPTFSIDFVKVTMYLS